MNVNNIVLQIEGIAELIRFFDYDFDVVDDFELTKTEIKTLMQLKFKSGQSLSYYSDKVGLKKGSFTSLTDKLEIKGLIKIPEQKEKDWKENLQVAINAICTNTEDTVVFLWDELPYMLQKINQHEMANGSAEQSS